MRKVLYVVALMGLYSQANAAVLCQKANGAVFIRSQCKPKETQLDPATVGLQAQGPAVYDVNGIQVGEIVTLASPGGPVGIALKVDTRRFPLWVYQNGFAGDDGTTGFGGVGTRVYFETPDCSGTAFAVPGNILPHVVVTRPGRTVYFADPAETSQPVTWLSFLPEGSQGQAPGPCSSEGGPGLVEAVPAIPLVDLDTLFTPPFSIQ